MNFRKPLHLLASSFVVVAMAGCDSATDDTSLTDDTTTPVVTHDTAPHADPTAHTDVTSDIDGSAEVIQATTTLVAIGNSGVEGTIDFRQEDNTVKITGEVRGLKPGLHGFHIHEKGDLSDTETGKSAGGHFNPTNEPHGKPSDEERHVGDLGNIEANEDGVAKIDIQDDVISLRGENSIIGRSLMIHEGEDKFTQPSGDAGGRVAFGKIESK
ncbi:superoxide dismutase family protein [Aporhodopirellula aestuarii]|uniref:Superoxide dismutase family protein n=1 Tax=Aporhodopirellula aestuarii TaxID=2950107 RepID=A0ABT0UAA8_9BACT|nr:superoxide dismutase family protein [Aporhodopirellula aestuarii]MCM2373833.1 superoxide dismutase family protein [Aporhodopirellula aestuarii]